MNPPQVLEDAVSTARRLEPTLLGAHTGKNDSRRDDVYQLNRNALVTAATGE